MKVTIFDDYTIIVVVKSISPICFTRHETRILTVTAVDIESIVIYLHPIFSGGRRQNGRIIRTF